MLHHMTMQEGAHLAPCAGDHDVLVVLGVRLHLDVLLAAGRGHREGPDLGAEVVPDGLLLRVEAHALANEVAAARAPHIEGHLEADDQDALVQLLGALAQRVLPLELQAPEARLQKGHCDRDDHHVLVTVHARKASPAVEQDITL